jgi:SAM-dependent methyltransferase
MNMNRKKDFIESYYPNFKKFFDISIEEFEKIYDESLYGGYPEEGGGSIWESEGKFIYVLIRTLKPKKILEIGNFKGKSSNHILQAVEKNGFGEVTLLDISERLEYDKLHNKKFKRIINDSLKFLNSNFEYDLIIQDGDHTYNHVKKEIELILKNNTSTEYYIWSHDYYKHKPPQCEVAKAWDELKNNFKKFQTFKDSISDCGFCISKK